MPNPERHAGGHIYKVQPIDHIYTTAYTPHTYIPLPVLLHRHDELRAPTQIEKKRIEPMRCAVVDAVERYPFKIKILIYIKGTWARVCVSLTLYT
jgi:hypothetical protein